MRFHHPSYPSYHFPPLLLAQILSSFLKNNSRNIKKDALAAIAGIVPPVHYLGIENIPAVGPVLITINHYSRSGFSIAWGALAVAAQLPQNQIWLMTDAWTDRKGGWDHLRSISTRWAFSRLARMYGAITTPALPLNPEEQNQRFLSLKKLFRMMRGDRSAVICVAPEGKDF